MKPSRKTAAPRFPAAPLMFAVLFLSLLPAPLPAAVKGSAENESYQAVTEVRQGAVDAHMVVIDGRELFRVAGIKSFPARERARQIAKRIRKLAADDSFDPRTISVQEDDGVYEIQAGKTVLVQINPIDVALEGDFSPERYAKDLVRGQIVRAIADYRRDRLPETLKHNALKALYRTAALAVVLLLLFWSFKKTDQLLEERVKRKIESLESKSRRIFKARQLWNLTRAVMRIIRIALVLLIIYVFLQFVLDLFPWTRHFARISLSYVTTPLAILGQAFIDYLPSLFSLIFIYILTRYLLGFIRAFFTQIELGQFSFRSFEAEWALPTYRILRTLIILLALVLAYPYIPGSGSEAFKGVTILAGILFSLGSTTLIANIIAGYTMTYRRAFKIGDRVKIGEYVGEVIIVRLQETHLRSLKNEEIVIPNSKILSGEVTNYSSMADRRGLILHTTVSIGYEVPWRQVEAMLLLAAERTEGLQRTPPPFVLQKELGDFAITYELNVFCRTADTMAQTYTELHRNILDAFNEHGVAIMTPHYEGDTEDQKIVPRDRWYEAPARRPPE